MILLICSRVFQSWGRSSAGRAPALQAGGHRFDPDRLHQGASPPVHLVVSRNVRVRCDPMPGQSASGLIAPYALGFGPRVAARKGGVVLCYCESGSGASLGACDQDQSVWAGGDPVVRLDCLTGSVVVLLHGKPCHPRRTPQRSATRVQRRCVKERSSSGSLRMVSVHGADWIYGSDPENEYEKGIRWMPWHQEAMKDVARCEKPRGAASRR
jgi:hypothetical protein